MQEKPLAVISGGTSGLGFAVAKLLIKNFNLALIFRSNFEKAEKAIAELTKLNSASKVKVFQENVVSQASARIVYGKIKTEFKQEPEILINAAGHSTVKLFLETDEKDFIDSFQSHFFGVVELTRIVVQDMMLNKRGKIINFSSIASISTNPGLTVYGPAKCAIEGFTRTLAAEISRYGLSVNAVQPGLTKESAQPNNSFPLISENQVVTKIEELLFNSNSSVNGKCFQIFNLDENK